MRTEDLTKLRLPSEKRSMYFFIGFLLPKAMRFRFSVTNHFRKNRLSSNLFNHDINCKKSYKNKAPRVISLGALLFLSLISVYFQIL